MGLTGKSTAQTRGHPQRPMETTCRDQSLVSHLPCPRHQTTCRDPWRPPTETNRGDHPRRLPAETHGDPWRPPMETCRDPQRAPVETTCGDHSWRPSDHISQSFALPPATKPVSHLPCPLPPNHLRRPPAETCRDHLQRPMEITHGDHLQRPPMETRGDHISQSFALPPATKPVSHSFALPSATKPVSHVPCPLPQNHPWRPMETTHRDPCRPAETTHGDHISQSFALPPATKPVSHSFALPPATKPPAETTHRDI